jgi:adenosylmethionine-8-amino-7-oxononanoate aminotransferase
MIVSDKLVEPFLSSHDVFLHGITFGGHPVSCAVALANLDIIENEDILQNVRDNESVFDVYLQTLADLPIVGDIRGEGFFRVIELVRNKDTRQTFTPDECALVLKGVISSAMFEAGLICRADDRAEPVIVLSPPLIAGEQEFAFIADTLANAFTRGHKALSR